MRRIFATVMILASLPGGAAAQGGYGRPADASCPTGPITHLFIDNHSIFDRGDPSLDPRFDWAYHLANALHFRTHRSVIARELLFRVGDCYDPALARESARLLRQFPFLARADVYGVRQPDGSYHVVVDTQDQWSTQVAITARLDGGFEFGGGEVQEQNLVGTGQSVRAYLTQHRVAREWGVVYHTPQLAATRWNLDLGVGRTRAGPLMDGTLSYPFVGEIGQWATRETIARGDRYFDFVQDGGSSPSIHVLLPIRDVTLQASTLRRWGKPGNLTSVGAGIWYEDLSYPGGRDGILFSQNGNYDVLQRADSGLANPVWDGLERRHTLRLLAFFGRRYIRWIQRRGLDSMRGVEDVRLGTDVRFGIGPGIGGIGSQHDLYGTFQLYSGVLAGNAIFAARAQAEGRRQIAGTRDGSNWRDVLAEAELLAYWKPGGSQTQTLFFRAAGAGGWNTRVPFQLTLGGDQSLRGYDEDRFPGGRRVNFTAEDRIYIGWPLHDVADLGATAFVDAGRMWPGGVPFGVDSGWRASAGFGLRAALPAGSRTTYRADIAFPLGDGSGLRGARVILSITEPFGLSAPFLDPQIVRTRPGGVFGDMLSPRTPQP